MAEKKEYCKCTCTNELSYSNCDKNCERVQAELNDAPPDELGREAQILIDLKKAWNAFRMRGFPHNTDNYGNETFERFLDSLQISKTKVNKCRCERCSGIKLESYYKED